MIKNLCELCGCETKVGDLCPKCQEVKLKVAKMGSEIVKSVSDVAVNLKLKGVELKAETEKFEKELISTFLDYAKKMMDDHFNRIAKG